MLLGQAERRVTSRSSLVPVGRASDPRLGKSTHGFIGRLAATRGENPKEDHMDADDAVVAVFPDHPEAEDAVKKLTAAGFEMKRLSVVGKGYHTGEKSHRLL